MQFIEIRNGFGKLLNTIPPHVERGRCHLNCKYTGKGLEKNV